MPLQAIIWLQVPQDAKFQRCDKEIYNESISHLPLISTLNNLWRAKRLFDLNYGSDKFDMSDHAEVEEILADAGRTSEGESNFESGPQAVTQVSNK